MSEWIKWNGGNRTVSGDTKVEVELADGKHLTRYANFFDWDIDESNADIIKYRIIKEEPTPEVKTLRDEFAIAALTGLISNRGWDTGMANEAYVYADLMMRERTK